MKVAGFPAGGGAGMRIYYSLSRLAVVLLAALLLLAGSSMFSATIPNQRLDDNYGVSGGNVNDISKRFCCSGTLGSLVTDSSSNFYILSVNHVLADSDQGHVGDAISQPGLIDNNCSAGAPARTVANLTAWPLLGTNVDAALAKLVIGPGLMNTTGNIQEIGPPSSVTKAAAPGLQVEKSGRTTGVTTGSVQTMNASVRVRYTTTCGGHKGFTIDYTNQVLVTPGTFSAGGDSGSLIVTTGTCNQPVALLFAGSSTSTIGNPIGEVLSKAGAALGSSVSFVGGTCAATTTGQAEPDSNRGQTRVIAEEEIAKATAAMGTQEFEIMSRPGVLGIGVGASTANSSEAVIIVYVDQTLGVTSRLPRRIGGVRVERILTDPFVAY
jgi:hypothetical protein